LVVGAEVALTGEVCLDFVVVKLELKIDLVDLIVDFVEQFPI